MKASCKTTAIMRISRFAPKEARKLERKYCSSRDALDQWRESLKSRQCPFCGHAGTLINHGYLRGYAETDSTRIVRGRRFFCSNRHRRPGCGGTFSVLLCTVIRRFSISANTLWGFISRLYEGEKTSVAWRLSAAGFSVRSGYRMRALLSNAQSRLRTVLCRIRPPPPCVSNEPLSQLTAHFCTAFPLSSCPPAEFQVVFQTPFLG